MNSLQDSKIFNDWQTKRVLGKTIPTSDDTYLHGLNRSISEDFPKAYGNIRLTGFTNHNTTKTEDLESKVQKLETALESTNLLNDTLRRIIGYSIPKERIQDALVKIASEYDIGVSIGKKGNIHADGYIQLNSITEFIKGLEAQKKLSQEASKETNNKENQ